MQTYDPNIIQAEHKNQKEEKIGKITVISFDTVLSPKDEESLALAYYRLPRRLARFLHDMHRIYGVVGFDFDFDIKGNRDFAVIIKAKETL
jgi:hypothetical protein